SRKAVMEVAAPGTDRVSWSRPTPARSHDDELATVDFVRRRRRVGRKRQDRLPQERPSGLVECPELRAEMGRSDKQEAACRHNRTAVVFAARVLHALRRQFGILTERDGP